jgi:DNA uptake protein ComE-like DNA-binding protein
VIEPQKEPLVKLKEPLVKLNEASESVLAQIKGIGPKRLKHIVSLRPFTDEAHLKKELPLIARKLLEWADSD